MIVVRLIVFSLVKLKVCLRIFFGLLYLPNLNRVLGAERAGRNEVPKTNEKNERGSTVNVYIAAICTQNQLKVGSFVPCAKYCL